MVHRFAIATTLLPLAFLLSAGCNKPADSETASAETPATAAGAAAKPPAPVQQIQSNPHIPEQAKAAIVAHMQGNGPAQK